MEAVSLEEVKRLILGVEQKSSEGLRKLTETNENISKTLKSVVELLRERGGRGSGESGNDSSELGGEEQYLRDSDTVSKGGEFICSPQTVSKAEKLTVQLSRNVWSRRMEKVSWTMQRNSIYCLPCPLIYPLSSAWLLGELLKLSTKGSTQWRMHLGCIVEAAAMRVGVTAANWTKTCKTYLQ